VTDDTRRPYTSEGAWQLDGRGKDKRHGGQPRNADAGTTRNLRNVWTFPTQPYSGSHFATFPEELVIRCIQAATSEKGCCAKCGAPWGRITNNTVIGRTGFDGVDRGTDARGIRVRCGEAAKDTLGWRPTCSHDAPTIPCLVLDPFVGSGTTCLVAFSMGRRAIGCDISQPYLHLAQQRIPPMADYGFIQLAENTAPLRSLENNPPEVLQPSFEAISPVSHSPDLCRSTPPEQSTAQEGVALRSELCAQTPNLPTFLADRQETRDSDHRAGTPLGQGRIDLRPGRS
jgi:hypothetical protein